MTDDRDFAKARRNRQTGLDSLAQRRESRRRRNTTDAAGLDGGPTEAVADRQGNRRSETADTTMQSRRPDLSPDIGPSTHLGGTQATGAAPASGTDGEGVGVAAGDAEINGTQKSVENTVLGLAADLGAGLRRGIDRLWRMPSELSATLRRPRLRLLPSVIFVSVIMLGFRMGDVWSGIHQGVFDGPGTSSRAEETVAPADDELDGQEEASSEEQSSMDIAAADGAQSDERPGLLETLRDGTRSATERELLDDLAARRDALDARERDLSEREALQEIAERRIEEKMAELEDLREQIRSLLGEVDGEREQQLAGLVSIYENMRPGDAARIFDGLDMDVLIEVLDRMAQRRSAPIIANMQPERARAVTRELADRGQLPDLQPLQD